MLVCIALLMTSCGGPKLVVSDVAYQSIRNVHVETRSASEGVPQGKSILLQPIINVFGDIEVHVTNLTDSIMIIDRTKSFFVDTSGESTIYYDPTIRTTTNSVTTGRSGGGNVNVGSVTGALGLGGIAQDILNGVNVGGSKSNANTTSNTVYDIDQPTGAIAPHGRASMGRTFTVASTGKNFLSYLSTQNTSRNKTFRYYGPDDSYCKFSICISYSLNNGVSYEKIVSEYYCNTVILSPVRKEGKDYLVNDALREIMSNKADMYDEPWSLLYFNANMTTNKDYQLINNLYDYQ